MERDALVSYLDRFLRAGDGRDHCPNGLQVEGRARIQRMVTGVSACGELFARAEELAADAVLVHHGLFWQGSPRVLTGVQYRRVAQLVRGEINLLAYHLPLDRHEEVGNNAVAARKLGLLDVQAFVSLEDLPLGRKGRLEPAVEVDELLERMTALFGRDLLVFPYGPSRVSSIGIVSGAGGRCFNEAIAENLDLFLTGEADEWTMNLAKESGLHFVAAGHHATERLGIQELGEHVQARFGLEVVFVDLPNPV